MKKYINLTILLFLYSFLFSQKTIEKDTSRYDYLWKYSIEEQDDEERRKAYSDPIVKKVYDTLGSDYLEQHFYHNGNLYYQVPFKDGKKNGLYEEYHPNGQFRDKREMKDGYYVHSCDYISFDRFGDVSSMGLCIFYNEKQHYCQTDYFYGRPSYLRIYDTTKGKIFSYEAMVAEFKWSEEKKKWIKHDYHCKSVKYARKLLKLYRKKTVQITPKK